MSKASVLKYLNLMRRSLYDFEYSSLTAILFFFFVITYTLYKQNLNWKYSFINCVRIHCAMVFWCRRVLIAPGSLPGISLLHILWSFFSNLYKKYSEEKFFIETVMSTFDVLLCYIATPG